MQNFQRVPFDEIRGRLAKILRREGVPEEGASKLAEIYSTNSLEGVPSHGVHMFPWIVEKIRSGRVTPGAEPQRESKLGAWERWDGNQGPGPLNSLCCTDRAIELAMEHGLGGVALRHTNHWGRAAYYGYHAVKSGVLFLAWTNTTPVMPAWGTMERSVGNNPLVMAFPSEPWPMVLDMAMSQFSMGRLRTTALLEEQLPVDGGYDEAGSLTRDPVAISHTRRSLPIGFWKGSGLALMLDLFATAMTGGKSTAAISRLDHEDDASQFYLAIRLMEDGGHGSPSVLADEAIALIRSVQQDPATGPFRFPGEGAQRRREENLQKGVPISEKALARIREIEQPG